ncbi:hypothetical protein LXL04_002364 [Taraxacum kok-saghyz]
MREDVLSKAGRTCCLRLLYVDKKHVEEAEKALKLQAGEVSEVQILGTSNGNGLPEETVVEDDRNEGDDNDETMGSNTAEEEFKAIEEADIDDVAMKTQNFLDNGESLTDIAHVEDVEEENNEHVDESEKIEEITTDVQSNEESYITFENEIENENKIPLTASESNRGEIDKDEQENGNTLQTSTNEHETIEEEKIMDDKITPMEITMEEKADNKVKLHGTKKEPEQIINTREIDFNNISTTNPNTLSKSNRSNSTCSESSNGDGTTPTDSLLQKNSPITKKTSTSYGTRSCCYCSWWNVISNRFILILVSYYVTELLCAEGNSGINLSRVVRALEGNFLANMSKNIELLCNVQQDRLLL